MKYNPKEKRVIVEPSDWDRLVYKGRPILSIVREAVQEEAAKKGLNLNIGSVIAVKGNIEIEFHTTLEEVLDGIFNPQRGS